MAKGKQVQPSSGRPRGVPNKNTALLENFAKSVAEGGAEKFLQELNSLSGKQYVDAYLTLFEYVRPKLNRTTIVGEENAPVKVEVIRMIEVKKNEPAT